MKIFTIKFSVAKNSFTNKQLSDNFTNCKNKSKRISEAFRMKKNQSQQEERSNQYQYLEQQPKRNSTQ